jgi:small subunit ribosomal protein S16
MAVKIRLTREGRRNRAFFRIGAFDTRTHRDGKSIEILGHYNPIEADDSKKLVVDAERIRYWFDQGAIPSDSVLTLLRPLGIRLERAPKKKSGREARKRKAKDQSEGQG